MAKKTFNDIMSNLDEFRGTDVRRSKITRKQKDFILKCRDHENPVQYKKMVELWNQVGWGKTSTSVLRRRYEKIKANDIEVV